MATIYGLASFPGVNQIVEGSFSFTQGITPSSAMLTITPQIKFTAIIGDLVLWDSVNPKIVFHACRVDTNSFERSHEGLIWRLAIEDRRWKWTAAGGGSAVSGCYNLRDQKGKIIAGTEKSPQDLATLCFESMGESNYEVDALPNDSRPQVNWDYELAAEALEKLCEELGCRVVLGLDDVARIIVAGEGNELPNTQDIVMFSPAIHNPALPDTIAIVGGLDQFQVDFLLEAVGVDTDGSIKLLDNLTYKPSSGWDKEGLDFDNVGEQYGDLAQNLALKSVWKYYRLVVPAMIPGLIDKSGQTDTSISERWKIKLLNHQVIGWYYDDAGNPTQKPKADSTFIPMNPLMWGVYYRETDGEIADGNTATLSSVTPDATDTSLELHEIDFSIDNENNIVIFSSPVYYNGGTGVEVLYQEPWLCLRTACTLLSEEKAGPCRYNMQFKTGGNQGAQGSGNGASSTTRYEKFDDLILSHWPTFDSSGKYTGAIDTLDDFRKEAKARFDGLMKQYAIAMPQTVVYTGLKSIAVNGAIQHVVWKIGKGGCFTTASRHTEQLRHTMSRSERRLLQKAHAVAREATARARNEVIEKHRGGG
jgi:hypothetical protein